MRFKKKEIRNQRKIFWALNGEECDLCECHVWLERMWRVFQDDILHYYPDAKVSPKAELSWVCRGCAEDFDYAVAEILVKYTLKDTFEDIKTEG